MQMLVYKQIYISNTQKFHVLMKLEPWFIPNSFLHFSDSEPW